METGQTPVAEQPEVPMEEAFIDELVEAFSKFASNDVFFEGISSTNPKTGKKIYPGTPEWDAKFGKGKKKKNKKQPEAEMGGLDGSDTVPSIYKEGEADETVLKLAGVYK